MSAIKPYDYLVVGAGLFGAVFAQQMTARGKRCLVIDRRCHVAGNCATEKIEGIQVHKYGAHIFHTKKKHVWEYVNRYADFNHYTHTVIANYKNEIYNLPFNMNTFQRILGLTTPAQVKEKLVEQYEKSQTEADNFEEQALSLVGRAVYEKLIKGYTEKQWGCPCTELPAFIIRRLPVRFTYDNQYFSDPYQGIPVGGYTAMVERMLYGVEVQLGVDFISNRESMRNLADKVLYTGAIDEYFDYCYGALSYRSLRFEMEVLPVENAQGIAVINFTDKDTPYTRRIEHKHFEFGQQGSTVITTEYPVAWEQGREAYYPVNDERNQEIYAKYKMLADVDDKIVFGGRLGMYQYLDMDAVIDEGLRLSGDVK